MAHPSAPPLLSQLCPLNLPTPATCLGTVGGGSSCPSETDSFYFRPALEPNVFGLEMSHLGVSLSCGCLPWSREHVYGGLGPPGRLQVRAGLCSMCSGPHPILRLSSGDTGRIEQLAKPRPREAKWLPQSAGAGIPTWAVQIQAQFLPPWAQGDEFFQGFLWQTGHTMSPRSHRPQAEPHTLPQAPSGTCPALGSKQHWAPSSTGPSSSPPLPSENAQELPL